MRTGLRLRVLDLGFSARTFGIKCFLGRQIQSGSASTAFCFFFKVVEACYETSSNMSRFAVGLQNGFKLLEPSLLDGALQHHGALRGGLCCALGWEGWWKIGVSLHASKGVSGGGARTITDSAEQELLCMRRVICPQSSSKPYFLMTLRSWSMSNSSVASLPANIMMLFLPPGCSDRNSVTSNTWSPTMTQQSLSVLCFATSSALTDIAHKERKGMSANS